VRSLGRIVLLVVAAGMAWAVVRFPHIADVETGRTPEYADLQPQTFALPQARVAKAAEEAIGGLPGFLLVGSGSGAGGHSLQATVVPLPGLKSDLTVKIRREKAGTVVSVRSLSPGLPWDFGQNARNIRAFQEALGARLR
jgi:hypothetical protein